MRWTSAAGSAACKAFNALYGNRVQDASPQQPVQKFMVRTSNRHELIAFLLQSPNNITAVL